MPRGRSEYDAAARQSLQDGPYEFFRLGGIPLPVKLLPTEFGDARKLRVDYLAEAAGGQLVHIEFQAWNERRMQYRMLEYRCAIKRFTGKAPLQFVLYGGRAPLRMSGRLREHGLVYEFPIIDLRQLEPGALMESGRLADNFLSILSERGDWKDAIDEILQRVKRGQKPDESLVDLYLIL